MQASDTLTAKEDNLFGICAALGEDFGFNPLWLRLALAVSLLWNPWAVLGAYALLGVAVALSRLIVPNPRRRADAGEPQSREANDEMVELAQAA